MLGKSILVTNKVLIFKAFIKSCINPDKFVSLNNVLRKYKEMKEKIKNPETSVQYTI